MEFLKVVLLTIIASVVYGLVHDQVTIRICPEYFTVFHPRIMDTKNLTLIALGWGVVATWWMGAGIGVVLGLSARWGTWPRLTWLQILPSVAVLLVIMGICALLNGVFGYFNGGLPLDMAWQLPSTLHSRFAADWYAHMASYASGFFGGLGLGVYLLVRRYRIRVVMRGQEMY